MTRKVNSRRLRSTSSLAWIGLEQEEIEAAINYVQGTLDAIDEKLIEKGSWRLSNLVELANLSAIVGNLFRVGIVQGTKGRFKANAPHTYPDLIGNHSKARDVEIKIALENNKPKGHLVKPGPHITIRYVLGFENGSYEKGKANRGALSRCQLKLRRAAPVLV